MARLLRMSRRQADQVAVGHCRGAWAVPALRVEIRRIDAGWRIQPMFARPDDTRDPRALWLADQRLAGVSFPARRDALRALTVAAQTCPPGFLDPDPCPACNNSGLVQYDDNHASPCKVCCAHDQGFWQTSEHHAGGAGRWLCRGCSLEQEVVHAGGLRRRSRRR